MSEWPCSAAILQGCPAGAGFSSAAPWGFHAMCINFPQCSPGRFRALLCATPWGMQMSRTTENLRSSGGHRQLADAAVVIICGCAIALLSFGPRSSLGFFVQPMGREFAWGRDVFGLALALAEPAVGPGSADRRRDRRPLRDRARHGRRRAALCRRPAHDALFDDAVVARHQRRRADRLRPVRLLVQPGAVGLQQVAAAGEARHRARRRHRRRIVRPVPVRAVRRRA